MIEWFHPSILFIFGAFLIPFLSGKARQIYLVLIPALAFIDVVFMSQGTYWTFTFMGNEIIFGKADSLSLLFAYVFTIAAFIGLVYALHLDDAPQHMAAFFYIGSSIGVVFAGDYLTLFIFWEIMAFASAYLVFARKEKAAVDAGFRYILMHVTGGVFLLGGIVLHYIATGSILFGPIEKDGSLAFYLIFIGFILNAAAPPLNAWLTDAYPEATVTGAVFMSAFTTKTAVYVLARAFPGTELLIGLGVFMAIFGMAYAIMENDCRRVIAYSIISQVGYLLTGIGIGTELGLNGTAAHAFTDIIFKGLLFMATGAVIHMTGKRKLTELGGLYKTMPVTFALYMAGALSVSAFPFFSGFVSKSMIIAAAQHDHMAIVTLLLTLVSAGTFLYTGLRLPYYMFFAKESQIKAEEPPRNMLAAMGIAAFLCIAIGVFPGALYAILPNPVHFEPYTFDHITGALSMLLAAAAGFFMLRRLLAPEQTISIDTDWFYRIGARIFMWIANKPIAAYEGFVSDLSNTAVMKPLYAVARISLNIDKYVVDGIVNGVASLVLAISARVRRVQTGLVQHYAMAIAVGIFVIIAIYAIM